MDVDGARGAVTRLVVTAELQAGLDGVLAALVDSGGATAAAIVERSGLPVATRGNAPAVAPAIGALAAGVFKSLETLAGLLGEEPVRELRQRGPQSCTAMALLASDDLLVATFPAARSDTQMDGHLEAASRRAAELMTAARSEPPPTGRLLDPTGIDDVLGSF